MMLLLHQPSFKCWDFLIESICLITLPVVQNLASDTELRIIEGVVSLS
jgi:hypothetical protein